MQLSSIITIIAVAMTAAVQAAPNPATLNARTGGSGNTPDCSVSGDDKTVCCLAGYCTVSAIACAIGSGNYCCKTNSAAGALVNVNLLNCVKIL